MSTKQQIAANRKNAKSSTGPTSQRGKARSSSNARRHGLNLSLFEDPEYGPEVEKLARMWVGKKVSSDRLSLARRAAEAQLELTRIRRARHELLIRTLDDPNLIETGDPKARALNTDFIMRVSAATGDPPIPASVAKSMPILEQTKVLMNFLKSPSHDQNLAIALANCSSQLAAFNRYERRALSRRKFAIRQLEKLMDQ